MAQSVKRPILDFGSGHDLTVREFKPCIGLGTDDAKPAWDSLPPSPFLSAPPLLTCGLRGSLSLSLFQNKYIIHFQKIFKKLNISNRLFVSNHDEVTGISEPF